MRNVRRLTVITLCVASACAGSSTLCAQEPASTVQTESTVQDATLQDSEPLPSQWNLQTCIDYALQHNITLKRNRISAESAEVDVKTAKAAFFPSLSASVSQRIVNRPNSESGTIISGDNITSSSSKT